MGWIVVMVGAEKETGIIAGISVDLA